MIYIIRKQIKDCIIKIEQSSNQNEDKPQLKDHVNKENFLSFVNDFTHANLFEPVWFKTFYQIN